MTGEVVWYRQLKNPGETPTCRLLQLMWKKKNARIGTAIYCSLLTKTVQNQWDKLSCIQLFYQISINYIYSSSWPQSQSQSKKSISFCSGCPFCSKLKSRRSPWWASLSTTKCYLDHAGLQWQPSIQVVVLYHDLVQNARQAKCDASWNFFHAFFFPDRFAHSVLRWVH